MSVPTELRPPLFASTAHQIAGQVSALKELRARIGGGKTVGQIRGEINEMIAELESRLAINAAAGDAVLPEYLGKFIGGEPQGAAA